MPNAWWRGAPAGAEGTAAGEGEQGTAGRGVVIIKRSRQQQASELQRAAEAVVDRMAAKRHFPQVEIYVPAPRPPLGASAPNRAGGGIGGA